MLVYIASISETETADHFGTSHRRQLDLNISSISAGYCRF